MEKKKYAKAGRRVPRSRLGLAAGGLTLTLSLLACGSTNGQEEAPASPPPSSTTASTPRLVNNDIPPKTSPDQTGCTGTIAGVEVIDRQQGPNEPWFNITEITGSDCVNMYEKELGGKVLGSLAVGDQFQTMCNPGETPGALVIKTYRDSNETDSNGPFAEWPVVVYSFSRVSVTEEITIMASGTRSAPGYPCGTEILRDGGGTYGSA